MYTKSYSNLDIIIYILITFLTVTFIKNIKYDVMIIMITHIIIHIKHITFLKCFHRLKCIQVSDRLPKFFRSRYLTFTHQNDQLYRHKISYIVVFWYTFYEKENTNLYVFRVVAT